MRGHSPNFHIHMFVSELYISTNDLPILLQENNVDRSWKLGLRPRNSQKRNTYMGFSLQCSTTGLYELDKISKTFGLSFPLSQGLINYKETKTKCRLYWYLIEFIDWRYSQQCWYFLPNFVNYCLYNLLSGSLPPPSPFPKSKYNIYYTDSVWMERVGGVVLCWRPYRAGV